MNSLVNFFDPKLQDEFEDENMQHLPPEPQLGNVEYKLKLINPSKQRFQHLVTQMKWRLREGQGEAIYEIGVEDNGVLIGLSLKDMKQSLGTLNEMALKLGASIAILRQRRMVGKKFVCEVLVRKIPDDRNNIEIRVAILGNVDAGKSTLLGVLTRGSLDNGRGRARLNMFKHLHEVQSGRTSSISHEILGFNSQGEVINYKGLTTAEEICEVSTKLVTFLDLAGHRKYIHTTIQGLSGYSPHYAMLIISGTAGVVGMTQEHLSLAIALNLPFFIVITKIDLTNPGCTSESVQSLLKQVGSSRVPLNINNIDDIMTACSNKNTVPIFCVSSVTGEGLELLLKFLHILPPSVGANEKERLEQESPEFQIDENFQAGDLRILGGLLTKGVITEGMRMQIGPLINGTFKDVTVKSIHRNRVPCRVVRAGQCAALTLNTNLNDLRNGMVLISNEKSKMGCIYFQANVSVLYHPTSISSGFQATVHIGNIRQTVIVVGIFNLNCLHSNEQASVLFKFQNHPEYVNVGQRLLFREGPSKGIGEVSQVFPLEMNFESK